VGLQKTTREVSKELEGFHSAIALPRVADVISDHSDLPSSHHVSPVHHCQRYQAVPTRSSLDAITLTVGDIECRVRGLWSLSLRQSSSDKLANRTNGQNERKENDLERAKMTQSNLLYLQYRAQRLRPPQNAHHSRVQKPMPQNTLPCLTSFIRASIPTHPHSSHSHP